MDIRSSNYTIKAQEESDVTNNDLLDQKNTEEDSPIQDIKPN